MRSMQCGGVASGVGGRAEPVWVPSGSRPEPAVEPAPELVR